MGTADIEATSGLRRRLEGMPEIRILDWRSTGEGYETLRVEHHALPDGYNGFMSLAFVDGVIRFTPYSDGSLNVGWNP